jgi:hypothetical protein
LLTGGTASRSHLPMAEGSSLRIRHVSTATSKDNMTVKLRVQSSDAQGHPIPQIKTSAFEIFANGNHVEPTWWKAPSTSSTRLTMCVPSRVGVAGDRTAEGVRAAVNAALDELNETIDSAGIVLFDGNANILQEHGQPTSDFVHNVDDAMQAVKSDSATNIGEAISLAQSLSDDKDNQRSESVLVIADATDNNISKRFDELARESRKRGVSVDVFGVNDSLRDNNAFAELAARCGGVYLYAGSMRELQRLIRQRVREIKTAYHVGFQLNKAIADDEPLLIGTLLRTPRGTLADEVLYTNSTTRDWLTQAKQNEKLHETRSLTIVEWCFALGTLGVLFVSLAIPFVRIGRGSRVRKPTEAPSKLEILPPAREEPPQTRIEESRKELDRPLPSPPPAGTRASAPSRPPPMRRGKDLR